MTITPAAQEQLDTLLSVGEYLEVGLTGGGCGGFNVVLSKVDGTTTTGSNIPVSGTDKILWADLTTQQYLHGGELQYTNEHFNATFVLKPPLGIESCGCGSSIKVP